MQRPTSPEFEKAQLPELAPFGIMSPATTYIRDNSEYWLNGYSYRTPDDMISVVVGDMVAYKDETDNKVTNTPNGPLFREYKPVNIRVSITASTMGTTYDELDDTVKSVLDIAIQKAVEREFWNGAVSAIYAETDNRWLDESAAIDHTSIIATGIKAKVGVALLEQALADATIGSRGCLHMPRGIASIAVDKQDDDEKTLVTGLMTPVVAGTGYQMNANHRSAWIFGTGPVTVRQGKPLLVAGESGALNRQTNTYQLVFNVPVGVTWSTTELHAVQVDLSLDNN